MSKLVYLSKTVNTTELHLENDQTIYSIWVDRCGNLTRYQNGEPVESFQNPDGKKLELFFNAPDFKILFDEYSKDVPDGRRAGALFWLLKDKIKAMNDELDK